MYNQAWVKKRLEAIIKFYGPTFFKGKTVLDVGAGYGEFAVAMTELGAFVTCVDARQKHLYKIKARNHLIRCVEANLENEWPFTSERFDLILHLATLNHTVNIEKQLVNIINATEYLVLETQVCDSNDPNKIMLVKENKLNEFHSYSGIGSRPSTGYIENIFNKNGMTYQRLTDSSCNSKEYIYDWMPKDSGIIRDGLSRMWFAQRYTINNTTTIDPGPINPTQDRLVLCPLPPQPRVPEKIIVPTPPPPTPSPPLETKSNPVVDTGTNTNPKPMPIPPAPNPRKHEKRVAVCFSGHMRAYERCINSLRNFIINPNACDIFIHTWDVAGFDPKHGDTGLVNRKVTYTDLERDFHPKNSVIEPMRKFGGEKYMKHAMAVRDPEIVLGMFYKIKAANDLKCRYEKENDFRYDYVIRCRTDILFERELDVSKSDPNKIALIKEFRWGGENDKFAFGNSTLMDQFCSIFDHVDEYWSDGCVFHPETMIKYHIQRQNLPHHWLDIPYSLQRGNGTTQRI